MLTTQPQKAVDYNTSINQVHHARRNKQDPSGNVLYGTTLYHGGYTTRGTGDRKCFPEDGEGRRVWVPLEDTWVDGKVMYLGCGLVIKLYTLSKFI
jgi:hypothetical protein